MPGSPRPAFLEFRLGLGLLWDISVWNIVWLWVTLNGKPQRTYEKQELEMRKTFKFRIRGVSEM